jgi:shikimate kinase
VIYLSVKPQSLWARLQHDDSRPLLQASDNVRGKLEALFEERDPIYRSIADHVVSGENLTLRVLTTKIINTLKNEKFI